MIFQPDYIDLLLFVALLIGVAVGVFSCKLAAFIERRFKDSRQERMINKAIKKRRKKHYDSLEEYLAENYDTTGF